MGAVTLRINNFDLPVKYTEVPEVPSSVLHTYTNIVAQEAAKTGPEKQDEARKTYFVRNVGKFPMLGEASILGPTTIRGAVRKLEEMGPELSWLAEKAYVAAEIAGVVLGVTAVGFIVFNAFVPVAIAALAVSILLVSVGAYEINKNENRKLAKPEVERLFQETMGYLDKHIALLRNRIDPPYQEMLKQQAHLFATMGDRQWTLYMDGKEAVKARRDKRLLEDLVDYFSKVKQQVANKGVE